MNYEKAKTILKVKRARGEITNKQYYSLMMQAKKKYSPFPNVPKVKFGPFEIFNSVPFNP